MGSNVNLKLENMRRLPRFPNWLSVSIFASASVALLQVACQPNQSKEYRGWENYGGSKDMIRYSSLTQIDVHMKS